ncbi:Uncharacterized protein APZ42_013436 [Daphnia magna]|uniref:Uncharacterized protein n=1 Tax=Daphnia magna TaxID=35525 RepID=A0A162QVP9_9CRUS|nr:Uncharacterized protein APZ42_013436 [Daphnia magna]
MNPFFEASNEWQLPQEIAPNNLEETTEKEQWEDQDIQSQDVPVVTSPQALADDKETVTEHPTADVVMVAHPASTEGTPAQRPIRNRRRPPRYLTCLVPFLMLLFTVFNPPMVTALILRENIIFKEHVDVAFSESAWTIVTDLDLGPAGAAIIAYLQQQILQQQAVADKWKQQGSRPQTIAGKRIFSNLRSFSKELESVTEHFTTVKEALNTNPRNRRSLIDGGGSALKWLFGVSTQQDLEELNSQEQQVKLNQKEMIHIMNKQATVLKE